MAPSAFARPISSSVIAASPHSATTSDLSRADMTSQRERSAALRSAALQIIWQKPVQPSSASSAPRAISAIASKCSRTIASSSCSLVG